MTNFLATVAPQADCELEARLVRDGVPAPLHDGVLNYVRYGIIPGGFLTALLKGDLFGAAVRADTENREALGQIALALVWTLPADAYGTPAKVERWAKAARTGDVKLIFPTSGL